MSFGVVDGLPNPCPRPRGWFPALGVRAHAAHQLLALTQVDEAVVGELRDQGLCHVPHRLVEFERSSDPFTDPFKQADTVEFPLVAAPHCFPSEDDDSIDGTGRVAQRRRLGTDEDPGSVLAQADEGSLPDLASQYLLASSVALTMSASSNPIARME